MTTNTALLLLSVALVANTVVDHLWHRRIWRAINATRAQRADPRKATRVDSGERRILRTGGRPDVTTIDDSGEHLQPGRVIDQTGRLR